MANININEKIGIHNRFDIEVVDARTKEIKRKARAFNVITDGLYDVFFTQRTQSTYFPAYCEQIRYGRGNGTPASSDTALFSQIAAVSASNDDMGIDYENRVAYSRRKIVLDESTAVGETITEVGIGTSNTLCSHALLEDMNGNPVSITKTDTDIITIYATVYVHWASNSKFTPGIMDSGILQGAILGRGSNAYGAGQFMSVIHIAKETNPLTSSNGDNPTTQWGYIWPGVTCNQANRTMTASGRLAVGTSNMGGIGSLYLGYHYNQASVHVGNASALFVPVEAFYAGSDITGEAVGTGDGETTGFALAFDFPENVKIYKNGNLMANGYAVKRIGKQNAGQYIRVLRAGSTDSAHIIEFQNANTNSNYPLAAGSTIFNQNYGLGFSAIVNNGDGVVYGSNNLTDWTLLASSESGTVSLTGANQNFKYYKNTGSAQANLTWNTSDGNALEFETAPALGDVITADYHTPYIAKDANHVLDLTVTFTLGEYTE